MAWVEGALQSILVSASIQLSYGCQPRGAAMDLDARPYRALVAIAQEHSFTRAAERLNLSQPALSAQIREFERRLGFALFERTSRSVALTAKGRLLLGRPRPRVSRPSTAAPAPMMLLLMTLRLLIPSVVAAS
jgi:DNA-binding transcriptional LysR family regulator